MENKKAMSMIVSTLIIILLVLVAVGVVWVVVNNLLQSGADQVELASKCREVNLQATKVDCSNAHDDWGVEAEPLIQCAVTLERGTGGEAIDGAKIIFTNETGTSNDEVEFYLSLGPLEVKTNATLDGINIPNSTKIKVVPYFKDDSGNEQLCSNSFEYTYKAVLVEFVS